MHRHAPLSVFLILFAMALLCEACAESRRVLPPEYEGLPDAPTKVRPLKPGDSIPSVWVQDENGSPVNLAERVRGKPSVLIFYRGGWCPYCNGHLADLRHAETELRRRGYQMLAISPDRPDYLCATKSARRVGIDFFSDGEMKAATAFGLAFVPNAQMSGYVRAGGVDLAERSGHDHYLLPVPAVFVVGPDGRITFVYANPDHRERIDRHKLLRVAKEIKPSP
jgi:peroxiredoxin